MIHVFKEGYIAANKKNVYAIQLLLIKSAKQNVFLVTLLNTLILAKKNVLIVKIKNNTIIKLKHANVHYLSLFKLIAPASHAISLITSIIRLNNANYVKTTFFITLISSNALDVQWIDQFLSMDHALIVLQINISMFLYNLVRIVVVVEYLVKLLSNAFALLINHFSMIFHAFNVICRNILIYKQKTVLLALSIKFTT